jgi:RND family efflux transporter MFP subunit
MSFIDQGSIRAFPPAEQVKTHAQVTKAAAFCLLAALLSACDKEVKREVVAQPVRVHVIGDGQKMPFRSFPGEVVSPRTGRLSFEVSGRLVEFPIQNGQLVKKGDLIGQLDRADFIAARDSAQANFEAAKINFERNEGLQRRGAVPMAELDRARQQLENANAALRTATRALDETRLLAPFDGRIANRIARELQNVRAQEQVAILEDISTLEIEINIPERDMMFGSRGLTVDDARDLVEAKVEFSTVPGQQIDIELKTFSTRANPVSRTFLVSFAFEPPPDQNILPGMTATVLLRRKPDATAVAADGKPVRMVPVEALTTQSGASTVWRLDPATMKVSAVPVELESIKGGIALIRSEALANGDEIVASGARFLAEGTPVRRMESRKP